MIVQEALEIVNGTHMVAGLMLDGMPLVVCSTWGAAAGIGCDETGAPLTRAKFWPGDRKLMRRVGRSRGSCRKTGSLIW